MPTPFLSAGSGPKVRKTVGIDLGTTNSVIALLDAADSSLLTGADEQGRMTFPSVLGWHAGQGRLVAGRPARDLKAPGPCETAVTLPLSSVKRFMGLDKQWALGPETLTPPQASAVILRLLREMMARTLNDSKYLLDSAVVTMPAYFNHNQIEATRQAGELAGYEVVELLHEPTAAAMYYSWVENHGDAVYLVYDLGGGTFDVSVIRHRLGDYEVLSVSGDPFLGGDDFDRLLATGLVRALSGPVALKAVARVQPAPRQAWRASSLVEGFNSGARRPPSRHRRRTPGRRALKRRYGNGRPFRTGRRRPRTPYGLLGLPLPTTDGGEWLRWPPEQLRPQLSAPGVAA